jgi:hypothetical protein
MAPEQFRGQPPSMLSDQYALAVLLFRLATSRYPFDAQTLDTLKALQKLEQRARLLDLRPDLPQSLLGAVERALSNDPAQRFRSIGALAQQLNVISETKASARSLSPAWIALVAMLLLAVSSLSIYALHTAVSAPTEIVVSTWTRNRAGIEETLRSGARVQPGEALALTLELARSQYVYVLNEDSFGARFQLFPLHGFALQNPLPAGINRLPGKPLMGREQQARDMPAQDWQITSRGGRERFYVIYSDQPLPELAQMAFTQASSAKPPEYAARDAEDAMRGVGGIVTHEAMQSEFDSVWLRQIKQAHPTVRVSLFEVQNP